ncbi:MAG: nitroreductase family deazaflavin-dependent oxidoreductase [Acidobacteria bacterium]|nr:nitroreductase family deazaflavin-dependent oxidoreductase [Acidobacteriota bacterium]MCU0314006.1 nitroreductase family deazaflavin-dependent oxidoreductase [Solirubrobacteraceae bacterium]
MPLIALILGGLLAALAATVAALAAGLRRRSPAAMRTIRRFNRAVVNPRMLKTAGTPGAYASVIEHRGRRSGRTFRTPVVAGPTDDGFVIALVYGEASDWLRNVLAAGSARITREGETWDVTDPEVLPIGDLAEWFPDKDRRSFARFRVERCLRVRRRDASEG